jgi:hypothetical protein
VTTAAAKALKVSTAGGRNRRQRHRQQTAGQIGVALGISEVSGNMAASAWRHRKYGVSSVKSGGVASRIGA